MKEICYNVLDLARLHLHNDNPTLHQALQREFSQYRTDLEDRADILVYPLGPSDFDYLIPSEFKNPTHFSMVMGDRNQPLVLAFYHGALDMVIEVGDQLCLYVTNRKKIAEKFIHLVLICLMVVLGRKGALLFKGAVITDHDKRMTLVGASGAGKTSILLQLLNQGWSYLSDNTFLSRNGHAHAFRRNIVFHAHHILAFPSVFWTYQNSWFKKTTLRHRDKLRLWGLRILPHYLLRANALRTWLDPYFAQDPKKLFPKVTILEETNPKLVVLLYSGPSYHFEAIDPRDALQQLILIHQLAWSEFDEVNRLMELHTGKPFLNFEHSLAANLYGKLYFRVVMPWGCSFEARTKLLLESLEPYWQVDPTTSAPHSEAEKP